VLVHKAIVGLALGGLIAVIVLSLVLHVILGDGTFADIQRFAIAGLLQVITMLVIVRLITNPPPRKALTWARAMAGAVLVSGLALLAFGSVPHEFLSFAGSGLHWDRRDLIMIDLPALPFDISRQAVRDIAVAGLYTNSFAGALGLWIMWQRRREMAEEQVQAREGERVPVAVGTSAFGRPVARQG